MTKNKYQLKYPSPLGVLDISFTAQGIIKIEFLQNKTQDTAPNSNLYPWNKTIDRYYKLIYKQLNEYFTGKREGFEIPLEIKGTSFQKKVWQELMRIPFGETRSYGEIARAIGQPGAARAVGMANHYNPLPIIIPCHRVVGARGTLGGYAGGIWRKKWLLQHEEKYKRSVKISGQRITFAR